MDMPGLSSRRFRVGRVALVLGLLLALGACAAGDSSPPAAVSPAAVAAPAAAPVSAATAAPTSTPAAASDGLAALIGASGVSCSNASAGTGCTSGDVDSGDFYDVELSPDCGDQGLFAGVAEAKGVEMLDAVPGSGSKATTTAKLSKGQLLCVQGIGRAGQNPLLYYVVAIPANTVGLCKGSALCDTYGDRPISGMKDTGGEACHVAAPGHYAGNCAQGWVSADTLEVFSSGL
ncbi:hypothetical protein [Stenotrophomonas sp. G106K1]|uniref:hypothetical protein n=1 Tax=Stenotrophomonas sp. G106K1 TaxID=3134792 RepID=UPI0030F4246D